MVGIRHKKLVTRPDDPKYDVSADEWNDDHVIPDPLSPPADGAALGEVGKEWDGAHVRNLPMGDTVVPASQVGQGSTPGISTVPSRSDHSHGSPPGGSAEDLADYTYGGGSNSVSRTDHLHKRAIEVRTVEVGPFIQRKLFFKHNASIDFTVEDDEINDQVIVTATLLAAGPKDQTLQCHRSTIGSGVTTYFEEFQLITGYTLELWIVAGASDLSGAWPGKCWLELYNVTSGTLIYQKDLAGSEGVYVEGTMGPLASLYANPPASYRVGIRLRNADTMPHVMGGHMIFTIQGPS